MEDLDSFFRNKQYYSIEFADKVLKNAIGIKAKATRFYDDANLYGRLQKSPRKLLLLDDSRKLINTIAYSFKHESVNKVKEKVRPASFEVLIFLSVKNNDIDVAFKFGARFRHYLKNQGSFVGSLENKTYKTTLNDFKKHFNNTLSHDNLMRFALDTLNVTSYKTKWNLNLNIVNYLKDILIFNKYEVIIFIEISQKKVLIKQNGGNYIPSDNQIYIWLVSKDSIQFDNFIIIEFGRNVAKDFKNKNITEKYLQNFILEAIERLPSSSGIKKEKIIKNTTKFLSQALLVEFMIEDLDNNPNSKKIFKSSPLAYYAIKGLAFTAKNIKEYKLKPFHWLPNDKNYSPIVGDSIENAFFCGVINGFIDELAGIPKTLAFFYTIFNDENEYRKFVDGIKKLLNEENLFELLVTNALEGYLDNEFIEKTIYQFGHDIIQIVSFIIGIFQFAKGVASFTGFLKKAIKFIKINGRKGIADLKKLNARQLKKLFDDIDNTPNLKLPNRKK
jgi:hypothetical protein